MVQIGDGDWLWFRSFEMVGVFLLIFQKISVKWKCENVSWIIALKFYDLYLFTNKAVLLLFYGVLTCFLCEFNTNSSLHVFRTQEYNCNYTLQVFIFPAPHHTAELATIWLIIVFVAFSKTL